MINDQFGHCQFVITTHDKTWASQLKQERVVQPSQMVEFTSWTVDDGPSTRGQTELWDQIQVDLDKGDVKEAAFKLRRSTEDVFESVCDALGAKIAYNSRMVWQLDDWLFPAMGEYKDVLNLARRAAHSWDQKELNQYQGGMCILEILTTTERTPQHLISPLGPNWVGTDSAV